MITRGFFMVALLSPKTPANVGSALRAAGCFGANAVITTGKRYTKSPTDPQKMYRHVPLTNVQNLREAIPYDCVPVAIDIIDGAYSLVNYQHPERAFYIFGPEDGTLGKETTNWCRDIVQIPSYACLNLAAAVNVVLYDRVAKNLLKSGY